MQLQLITSEAFVKSVTMISENIAGKYLLPAITEAQEIHLKAVLGETLLDKLKYLISNNLISGDYGGISVGNDYSSDYLSSSTTAETYAAYGTLIQKCQYFLAYKAVAELTQKVSYKVANMGVTKASDEHNQVASYDEIISIKKYNSDKADFFCKEIQNYLVNNYGSFPELNEGDCQRIRCELSSAASCGIWLGGPRGRK